MKKLLFIFTISIVALASCDKVDCPYDDGCDPQPTICVVNGIDTCLFDGASQDTLHSDTRSFRRVLIEEYTGYKCNNCPQGAVIIDTLLTKFGDSLIAVSIHSSDFAKPDPSKGFITDFRTEAGTEFTDEFEIQWYPAAVIDRTKFNASYAQSRFVWESTIQDQIDNKSNILDLNLTSVYNPGSSAMYATADIEFLQAYSANTVLLFYLIESSLIDQQDSLGTIITDYEHKHVFRGTLGNYTGESVTNEPATIGQKVQLISAPIVFDKSWEVSKCHVVALVYDADTKEVLQSAEIH